MRLRNWLAAGLIAMTMNTACANEPNWARGAADAQYLSPGQLQGAKERVAALSEAQRVEVERVLGELAEAPATVTGLGEAIARVAAAMPGLADPNSDSSGLDPAQGALRDGAICLTQGLVFRTGRAISVTGEASAAREFIATVEAIEVLGTARTAMLVEEARAGLGAALYLQARSE